MTKGAHWRGGGGNSRGVGWKNQQWRGKQITSRTQPIKYIQTK